MVTKVQKSIADSKLRKQFNARAKQRKEWKAKKATGELSKYVDKTQIKKNKIQEQQKERQDSSQSQSESDSDIEMEQATPGL